MNKEEKIIVFSLITIFIISVVFLSILIINRQQDDDNEDQDTNIVEQCFDSDNGKNYFEKGEVRTGDNKYPSVIDTCSGVSLREGICTEDGGVTTVQYYCSNGCQNGKCLRKEKSCPGPYHISMEDGRCVWSCGKGTKPDTKTNECVCKDDYIEIEIDEKGRRVCDQVVGNRDCGDTDGGSMPALKDATAHLRLLQT